MAAADDRGRRPFLAGFCCLVALLLVAPTLVVVPMSFTEKNTFQFPPHGFTTHWYSKFFTDPDWFNAAILSLKVAGIVVVVATTLGTLAAFGLVRGRGWWKGPVQGLLLAPMIVPGVITAIAIYYVFLQWHLTATLLGYVFAHTVLALPLVIVPIGASLQTIDRRLEQAAASLGAKPVTTFLRVTLPLIAPAMLTGALFAFLTSFDEAIVSLFLAGPFSRTLPVQLYQSVTDSIDPTIAATSSMLIVVTTSVLFLVAIVVSRRRIGRA
jgi:putative spermidine/putrescine transport system permease protein